MQDVPLTIRFHNRDMKGFAVPLVRSIGEKPVAFDIIIDKAFLGTLRHNGSSWIMDTLQDPDLVEMLANYLTDWYQPISRIKPTIYMGTSARAE